MPNSESRPVLSVVLIAYRMRSQAMNTLYSLSASYQHDVDPAEYEVIVVENDSAETLDADEVRALGPNFSYHRRQETRPTPVYAINFGVEQARGESICLMIDGARMLSPRVIHFTLRAMRMNANAVVAVPGYHLGEQDQRYSSSTGHSHQLEMKMLEKIDWKRNGYRLFDISVISAANIHGVFHPLMECNCLSFPREAFLRTGGADEGFQSPGGGSVNLDIYRNIAGLPEIRLVILAGEGSFHQYHGGVTTSEAPDLDDVLAGYREEFALIRGEYYSAVRREPVILGSISSHSLPFLLGSSRAAMKRFTRFNRQGSDPWEHDRPAKGEAS